MSDAQRWQRIEAALTSALEVTTAQRAALLDDLCADDAELRREVESLLGAHARAEDFLSTSADAFAAPYVVDLSEQAVSSDGTGSLIGRYRLIEEIGRGGMGAVWLAERADGHFEQRVALKLIKRGMDSDEILARFIRERQILARLEHPDIARLLDGGISDDGRPYFVMEHVQGVPLTQSCDQRQLPIEDRLLLFARVCRAVQYAHRNLVVHRDIKPSNVMVTDGGEVKLLDFGVAKLLTDDTSGEPTLTALASSGPMTPEYASPEQLTGQPVTTASDVYQLGVLFYELLTGHRPYRLSGRDWREKERLIREVEAQRPSTAIGTIEQLTHRDGTSETIEPDGVSSKRGTTAERLRRRLRGDLDAIALRALRKQPEQRQPSAEALAEDVERHLAFLPLRYGDGGWSHGARKFLRRYRVRLTVITLIVLASAGFASLYVSRIREERDRAQREVAKTTEMTTALRRVFRGWSPDAADRGKVSAETLLGDAVRRARLELGGEPEVLAATLSMLGDMHSAVGQRAAADSVLSQALLIQQRLSTVSSHDLAATLSRRGWLLQESGRLAEAETSLRGALAIFESLPGGERQEAIETHHGLGMLLRQQHKLAEAETQYREILRMLPARQQFLRSEATAELGYVLFMQGRYQEAVELLRPALALQRRLTGTVHKSTLRTMRYLASSLRGPALLAEAEALDREAVEVARTLYGENHPETTATLGSLVIVLERKGDFVAADSVSSAMTLSGRMFFMAEQTALSWRTLGAIRLVLGERADAERMLRRALTGVRAVLPQGHPDEGDMLNRLAYLLLSRNAPDADTIYAQAVAFDRRRPSNGPYFMTDGYEYLAWAARHKGDLALSETLYRRAVTLYEKELPVGHPYRVQAEVGLRETLEELRGKQGR